MTGTFLTKQIGVWLGMLLFFCLPLLAQAALDVQFENTPLFTGANILPGDVVARTVTVGNTGPDPETVIFAFENEFSDDLAEVMELAVTSNSGVWADNYFDQLFAAGEIDLGVLPAGDSRQYTFTASLAPSVGNAYQRSEMGFDLLIGWQDGETETDGGGSDGDNGSSRRGSGGGGGTGSKFLLYNEAVSTSSDFSAELTWNTNRSATSYAVCGRTEDGPFVLDADATFFGYQFATTEDTSKTKVHSQTLTDLAVGEYECRVASRQSTSDDFTTSGRLDFAFLPPGVVQGISTNNPPAPQSVTSGNIFSPSGSVAGASTGGGKGTLGGPTYQEWRAELDARRAKELAAEEAAASSSQAEVNEDALRERPTDAFASGTADDAQTGGFWGNNWWWILLLVLAGATSARALIQMKRA